MMEIDKDPQEMCWKKEPRRQKMFKIMAMFTERFAHFHTVQMLRISGVVPQRSFWPVLSWGAQEELQPANSSVA